MDSIACINSNDNPTYNVVKHTIGTDGVVSTTSASISLVQNGSKFTGSSNGVTYTLFPSAAQSNIIVEAYLTCPEVYIRALGVK